MTLAWNIALAGLFFAVCAGQGISRQSHFSAGAGVPVSRRSATIVFVASPVVRLGPPELRFPQGSSIVSLSPGTRLSSPRLLTSEFFAAADPESSFDGKSIVFAGKKQQSELWQIWEAFADGTHARQITHCAGDCLGPALLSKNQVAYTMVTGAGRRRISNVYLCNLRGDGAHPITFGPGNYQVEAVLRSGRILVSADWPLTAAGTPARERTLYTIQPDGSGLTLVRDTLAPHVSIAGGRELANGTLLFVESRPGGGLASAGQLAQLRPGTLRASLVPLRAAVDAATAEMPGNRLLISSRGNKASGHRFNLYTVDLGTKPRISLFYADPRSSSLDPVLLRPHSVPEHYWSILHTGAQTGRLVCLDAYLAEEARGGRIEGTIATVRVLALDVPSGRQLVLGEAPVESDGSFYAAVPADTPVRFQLVGPHGELLREQLSWIWARNGEDRACLGCHESKSLAPPDHWPLALRRHGAPDLLVRPASSPSVPAQAAKQ
jgi:hypothetical protein